MDDDFCIHLTVPLDSQILKTSSRVCFGSPMSPCSYTHSNYSTQLEFEAVRVIPKITVITVTVITVVMHLDSKVITLKTKTENALLVVCQYI